MICSKCGTETNGIKLNKKTFCTNCGELLSLPPQEPKPEPAEIETETKAYNQPKEFEPTAKVIDADGNQKKLESEIQTLEAEEEVIDLIANELKAPAKKAKKVVKDTTIKKHNRKRVFHHRPDDFKVYPNEPDPIKEPELEVPHDDMITTEPEEKPQPIVPAVEESVGSALLDDEVRQKVETKKAVHREAFVSFLKSGASQATTVKKQKVKKGKYKKLIIFTILIVVLIGIGGGFVFYMNSYALNPDKQASIAEAKAGLSITRPSYFPPGYKLSFLTTGQKDAINYVFEYEPDNSKRIDLLISKSTMSEDEVFEKVVKTSGKEYEETITDNHKVWYIDGKSVVFIKDGLLYQVSASSETAKGTLSKMAEGTF
jgi:hypothetical protein